MFASDRSKIGATGSDQSTGGDAAFSGIRAPSTRAVVDAGWGASLGYPALVLDPDGSAIGVDVFESVDLPAHWARLDAFEGPGYQRVVTTVHTPTGDVEASIYVVAQAQG